MEFEIDAVKMDSVKEYCEGYSVYLYNNGERLVIQAYNEGGYNSTEVDLIDLLKWIKENKPEILDEAGIK